jgi:hypothetical protein
MRALLKGKPRVKKDEKGFSTAREAALVIMVGRLWDSLLDGAGLIGLDCVEFR